MLGFVIPDINIPHTRFNACSNVLTTCLVLCFQWVTSVSSIRSASIVDAGSNIWMCHLDCEEIKIKISLRHEVAFLYLLVPTHCHWALFVGHVALKLLGASRRHRLTAQNYGNWKAWHQFRRELFLSFSQQNLLISFSKLHNRNCVYQKYDTFIHATNATYIHHDIQINLCCFLSAGGDRETPRFYFVKILFYYLPLSPAAGLQS